MRSLITPLLSCKTLIVVQISHTKKIHNEVIFQVTTLGCSTLSAYLYKVLVFHA